MTRTPYFPFYTADFMNGVRGLSAQEVGVYIMLLCRIYEENGPIEYHLRRLATYCGMRKATFTKAVETLIDLGKLTLADGMLSNARAEAEISKRALSLEIASRAGKASAEKRQQNQRQAATTVQQPFNHTDSDTEEEKKEEECARVEEIPLDSNLFLNVLAACGLSDGPLPTYWIPPAAEVHVNRWRQLGLSEAEILAVIRESQRDKPDKPRGPKAFDAAMRRLAAAKTAPVHQPPTARAGNRIHERHAFDRSIAELSAGLSAGTVKLDDSDRNPFAER